MKTKFMLIFVAFLIHGGAFGQCSNVPLVIVTCGNAFGRCSSAPEVGLMQAALAGFRVQVVAHNYAGGKYPAPREAMVSTLRSAQCGNRPIFVAGRSAGAWTAAIGGLVAQEQGLEVAGIVSYFGPLDLATLWQRGEWGKVNSPRGPINLLMPWGFPGCDNCNLIFPKGDAFYFDVNNDNDPRNNPLMMQALAASPIHYVNPNSPPLFLTQGTNDGIIGQYDGESQAERLYLRAGARPQDSLVICPGYAHGYNYAEPCTTAALRAWFNEALARWNAGVF
jgi:acetyl esterase/lipase